MEKIEKIKLEARDLSHAVRLLADFDISDDVQVELIKNNGSGIGYTVDMAFNSNLKGHPVTVVVPIVDSSRW